MERIRELYNRIKEWWLKFTVRQRTIIISIAVGVVIAIAVLVTVLTRKNYVVLVTCETTKEASEITELLDANSMDYKTNTEGTQISILDKQESQANLLLGANNIPTQTYSIDNVTAGGFSTTESDKQKRYKVFLQNAIAETLEANENIRKAIVQLDIPEDDGTLIASDKESFASITLELEGEIDEDAANALARAVATALGNETTANIAIIDTEGNLLFSGEDQNSGVSGGTTANSQLSMKKKAEDLVRGEVRSVLLGTELYDNIEIATNLDLDFSKTEIVDHHFTPAEDQTQGVLSHESIYSSEATGGVAGVPGTTSNDSDHDTTYVMQDYNTSSETVSEESRDYLPNEKMETKTIPPGLIQYSTSSISVAAKRLKVYKEEDVKAQGLLTDMTWDEYKAANSEQKKLDVDDDIYAVVQTATGIPRANISVVAYEVPVFIDKEGMPVDATDLIQILIILIILGLLAFVILRSMKSGKPEEEPEEELSVESLLQSTPAENLEDIELQEKSEARKMIEKFVDENPEAAANLLRNWLQEEWG